MGLLEIDPAAGFRADSSSGVLTVVLNQPQRLNCQSPTTWLELARVHRELPSDVRVVLFRAEGRAFSAGLDRALFAADRDDGIFSLADLSAGDASARIAAWQGAFDWTSRPDVVSVAAIQGHAIGAGCQLALGVDIRLAADDVSFAMPETTLGIVPDLGGTKRLVDLIGYSRALELCLTGRRVGADEALRIGLVSRVVPRGDLDDAATETVRMLLAVDRDAAAATKELLQSASTRAQHEQQAAEREAQYARLRALGRTEGANR